MKKKKSSSEKLVPLEAAHRSAFRQSVGSYFDQAAQDLGISP